MIKIKDLYISFDNEVIFKDFSLSIKRGEKVAITGKSGKGKTTLLNLIEGFIPGFKGDISIAGIILNQQNIYEIRNKSAWLPQEIAIKSNSVSELFYTPFNFEVNKKNRPDKNEIAKIFDSFEISEALLSKKAKEISGGQKQRILLASCILLKKPLLLLDEPTSALDDSIKKRISDLILSRTDLTVIAATHDKYWIDNSDKIIEL